MYSDAGNMTCQFHPGSLGHEDVDAQSFADWGIDYLKYDNCEASFLSKLLCQKFCFVQIFHISPL